MSIREELEHANYRPMDKSELSDQTIGELSKEFNAILVCDLAVGPAPEVRRSYAEALVKADIISTEQIDQVLEDESLQIVIPLHTLHVATEQYRHIPHASHFVSIWVDGKPYSTACQ